jgi:hypothetical protein
MIDKLKTWWALRKLTKATEPQKSGFKLIYTDSQKNKWYTVTNFSNLHTSRALMAWVFQGDSDYGMTSEKRQIAYEKMNTAINDGDLSTLAKIVGILESADKLYAEPEILLNLATCYTFLNDEKNDSYLEWIQEDKRKIWAGDPDCKSFFLQFAASFTQKFSESQEKNVQEYLEKARPVLNQINKNL